MNKNLFRFFVVLSCILILAVLGGGYLIFSGNRTQLEETSATSVRLVSRTLSSAMNDGIYPGSEKFQRLVDSVFHQYGNLLALTVYSPEKGVYYYRSLSGGLVSRQSLDPLTWKGRPVYEESRGPLITRSAPLSFSAQNTRFEVETAFSSALTLFNYKRVLTLFFVFTAFLIFTVFLLFLIRQNPPAETAGFPGQAAGTENPAAEAAALTPSRAAETPPMAGEPVPAAANSPVLPVPPVQAEVPERTSVPSVPTPTQDSAAAVPAVSDSGSAEPACIYSQKTGLVRRELLEDKLNQELKRSAAFDQDLVLAIFSLNGLDTQASMARFQTLLLESFPYRDLVFEFTDDSFALIIPNTSLDSSVEPMENFQLKLEKAGLGENLRFSAGVSARNGRLLTGHRLITEASRSCIRARGEKNGGIMLFRISPKKYRQVVSERSF